MNPTTATVRTVEGKVIEFAGVTARFIVAHPRLSAWIAFAAGFGLSHLVWR